MKKSVKGETNFIAQLSSIISILVGNCLHRTCAHPRATAWVNCSNCLQWYHCNCVNVLYTVAKRKDFKIIMFVETVNSCLINVFSLQSQMTSIAFYLQYHSALHAN